jgi:NADPH:quinone reductase-like Zn-dependent oxidoreductase
MKSTSEHRADASSGAEHASGDASPQPRTMMAIVQERYGAPDDVLVLMEIDKPSPGAGEVLVRVRATPVSGTDWHITRGLPYVARPVTGLRKPKSLVPGYDLSGTVESVGRDVSAFRTGDEVFGWHAGSYAEYASVPEGQLALKPTNLTLEQAAAVPIGSFTALQGVRDKGKVAPGQRVLITGASGGVGTYAVQIAKWLGAEVTAVCSAGKMDLVRSIGADQVIDYSREDLTARGNGYDVLIDLYGNPSLSECRQALKPGGTLVLVGGTGGSWFMGTDRWLRAMLLAPFLGVAIRPLIHKDRHDDLIMMKGLIEEGKVMPVLDRTYPLPMVAEAIQFVTDGRARGQVVVTT